MKKLLPAIFILFFFCTQVWAGGNIIYQEAKDKISLSNIIYTNRTDTLLLKTGQTTSYHADDDGDLELGIARSYTVLTTGQYAGNTNVTINGKTYAFPNACVKDNNTGKMWARTVPQTDIGPSTDGRLYWKQWTLSAETCTCNAGAKTITADAGTPFSTEALCAGRIFTILGSAAGNNGTFTAASISTSVITVSETVVDEASIALDFATTDDLIWNLEDQANANSLAGYDDWRIPNRTEIGSIIDAGNTFPMIDTTVFPSTPSSVFWLSTTNPNNTTEAYRINFIQSNVDVRGKVLGRLYVRLVRN